MIRWWLIYWCKRVQCHCWPRRAYDGLVALLCYREQLNDVLGRGGSKVGEAKINKDRHRLACAILLDANYFADNAIHTPKDFCRHFRMTTSCARKNALYYLVSSELHGFPAVSCVWRSSKCTRQRMPKTTCFDCIYKFCRCTLNVYGFWVWFFL
jgi:hypothetical protein